MRVGVLGSAGSIGSRHFKNLSTLGFEGMGYDPKGTGPEHIKKARQDVIGGSDAIVVATPTQQHANDLRDLIQAGKHVFIEKPIGVETDIPLIRECLDAAKHANLTVFLAQNLRYHGCVRAAKEKLLLGAIGKPLWASVTVGQFTEKEPYLRDGVTLNWGAHEIDLALYLLGPASVRTAWTDSGDTIADFCLDHSNGCRSGVHLDYVTNPEIRATTIVGDKGQLVIDLKARWCCITYSDGRHRDEFAAQDSWDSNYLDEMKGFLARINGHNDGVGATGEDGLATLKIIEAIKEKAKISRNLLQT